MKYLCFLLFLSMMSCKSTTNPVMSSSPEKHPNYLAESEHFIFYNPFWLNMHHFLHRKVLHRDTSLADAFEEEWMDQLSPKDKSIVREVVQFYQQELVDQDLRTSDYMAAFKGWAGLQLADGFTSVPDSFRLHTEQLKAFAPFYRQHFWPEHDQANRAILSQNIDLIKRTEEQIVEQLGHWTQKKWQKEKIRVDITYYAKSYRNYSRDRPFTTLSPTHIIMNATGNEIAGNWYEVLFHEASHHLITRRNSPVGETLSEAAETLNLKVPRDLWHAYLFYFSGKAAQQQLQRNGLPNYELYMVRNKVFNYYIPFLQTHLPDYLVGDMDLLTVSQAIIGAINEQKQ